MNETRVWWFDKSFKHLKEWTKLCKNRTAAILEKCTVGEGPERDLFYLIRTGMQYRYHGAECPNFALYIHCIHTYQVSCKSVIQITFVLYVYTCNDVYTISTPYNTHFEAVNIGLVNQITLMMYMLVDFDQRFYL